MNGGKTAERIIKMEWQYDEHGKKYRMAGNTKEYAPTVLINGIEVYQDEVDEFHRRNEEARKAQMQQQNKIIQQNTTGKTCPFHVSASFPPECKTICGLYRATGCAQKRTKAAQDTKDRPCPFLRVCTPQCALYDHGCTL